MNRLAAAVLLAVLAAATFGASAADPPRDLKNEGALGFPQGQAAVLCDATELRVSAWNDAAHLYVQAVVWADADESTTKTDDGDKVGDSSDLRIDVDADGKPTPGVDRAYSLNPHPTNPGLWYTVQVSARSETGLKDDSKGRGCIRYARTAAGTVRVDSYVIPLAEIGRKPGDTVRFAYYANSPVPALTLNSVGFERAGRYYSHSLPPGKYHEWTLSDRRAALVATAVPDGRDERAPADTKPMPEVGTTPPEVVAKDWLNTDRAPTLAGLRGKVVVVEFWATTCGPCVAGIPHLNEVHAEHGPRGLVILGLTEQGKASIETFMKKKPMSYVLGTGSELAAEYGVEGIPHAFIIGRDGKLAWHGDPNDREFDKRLVAALDAK